MWDMQTIWWRIGCLSGAPSFHANNTKYVCCGQDCPDIYNNCIACYFPSIMGDKISVVPSEKYCCCCSTRADCCSNCFGIYGPKTGEPMMYVYFDGCFKPFSAESLVQAANGSRAAWAARTGKP